MVGTRAMTPAAQAIWRSIRPMLNEGSNKPSSAPGLHGMDFLSVL